MGGKVKAEDASPGNLFGTYFAESAESEESSAELANLRKLMNLTPEWLKMTAAEKKAWLQANGLG